MKIEVKTVKLSQIKLNPDNPRRIGNAEMDRLLKSITEFPEMLEIREVVCDEDMIVLGGNQRLLALRKAGAKECIAKIVKGWTPEQKRRFIITDNGNFGEWNLDLLASWQSFPDVDLLAFGVNLPKDWLTSPSGGNEPPPAEEPEKPNIIICPKCGHEFSVLKEKKEK